ncbi:MAG: phasin family protein [Gammaproteobacteria bacterium]|nr:phasin family protein [Gammaproteobacteria bacterium]
MAKPNPKTVFEASFPKLVDATKMMAGFKMPTVDMTVIMDIHRKNVEAITAIQHTAYANMQTMAKQQADWMQQAYAEGSQALSTAMSTSTPSEKLKQHAEFTKNAVEKNTANAQQTIETIGKCNSEAMDIINNRIRESMEEISDLNKTNRVA